MIAKEINITHTGQILASFIIGLCLCLWTALNMKPSIGVAYPHSLIPEKAGQRIRGRRPAGENSANSSEI